MSLLTLAAIAVALVVAVLLALALAWLPMRLLLGRMARDISNFIERQRERRRVERTTPDRRHT